jgi:hypothetical protein
MLVIVSRRTARQTQTLTVTSWSDSAKPTHLANGQLANPRYILCSIDVDVSFAIIPVIETPIFRRLHARRIAGAKISLA